MSGTNACRTTQFTRVFSRREGREYFPCHRTEVFFVDAKRTLRDTFAIPTLPRPFLPFYALFEGDALAC